MKIFMQFFEDYWWTLVIALVVIIIAIVAIIILKNKKPRIRVDEAFITKLLELYGSGNNIEAIKVDNGRLKIDVKDLDKVNLAGIKEVAEAGVFVTGNTIKTLYKLDSLLIKQALEKRI